MIFGGSEHFGLVRTAGPASEPLTLQEVKDWIRSDTGDTGQDAVLSDLIVAARTHAEERAHIALVTQTWQLTLDRFPGLSYFAPDNPGWDYMRLGVDADPRAIRLPRPPLQSVSSVAYVDMNGVTQTVDPALYLVDTTSLPGRLFPAYGQYWPVTRPQAACVTVTYIAGYGGAGAVPIDLKTRLRQMVGYLFENREEADPQMLDKLIESFAVEYGVSA